MVDQYKMLLSTFSKPHETEAFNYSELKVAVPDIVVQQLNSLSAVAVVDSRLVLNEHVGEVSNFTTVGKKAPRLVQWVIIVKVNQ